MGWLKKILNNNVDLYDKYAYVRLAHNRGNHHLSIMISAYAKIPEFLILIKLFNIGWVLGIFLAIVLVILEFVTIAYVGHIDLQNDLMSRDMNLSNRYNPQIKQLLENTKK